MYFGHQCRGGYKYLLNKQELLFLFAAISTSLSLTAQVNNTGGIYISGNVYAASDFTNASSGGIEKKFAAWGRITIND